MSDVVDKHNQTRAPNNRYRRLSESLCQVEKKDLTRLVNVYQLGRNHHHYLTIDVPEEGGDCFMDQSAPVSSPTSTKNRRNSLWSTMKEAFSPTSSGNGGIMNNFRRRSSTMDNEKLQRARLPRDSVESTGHQGSFDSQCSSINGRTRRDSSINDVYIWRKRSFATLEVVGRVDTDRNVYRQYLSAIAIEDIVPRQPTVVYVSSALKLKEVYRALEANSKYAVHVQCDDYSIVLTYNDLVRVVGWEMKGLVVDSQEKTVDWYLKTLKIANETVASPALVVTDTTNALKVVEQLISEQKMHCVVLDSTDARLVSLLTIGDIVSYVHNQLTLSNMHRAHTYMHTSIADTKLGRWHLGDENIPGSTSFEDVVSLLASKACGYILLDEVLPDLPSVITARDCVHFVINKREIKERTARSVLMESRMETSPQSRKHKTLTKCHSDSFASLLDKFGADVQNNLHCTTYILDEQSSCVASVDDHHLVAYLVKDFSSTSTMSTDQ